MFSKAPKCCPAIVKRQPCYFYLNPSCKRASRRLDFSIEAVLSEVSLRCLFDSSYCFAFRDVVVKEIHLNCSQKRCWISSEGVTALDTYHLVGQLFLHLKKTDPMEFVRETVLRLICFPLQLDPSH